MRRFFLRKQKKAECNGACEGCRGVICEADEAGQCGTDLQQTHSAAVLSIENDIASQKRVFRIVSLQILCL